MRKFLFYLGVFVTFINFSYLRVSGLPKGLSAETLKVEIENQYKHNLDQFKKDFISEFLDWEVTTQEAVENVKEILTVLLETRCISQEDFVWFTQILQKKSASIGS